MNFDWQFFIQGASLYFITILVCVLLLPFEKFFPRLPANKQSFGRLVAILVVSLTSLLATFLYLIYGQDQIIRFLLSFQIANISLAPVPDWSLAVGSILIIDFLNYSFHWLSHKITVLWRLHSIHHSDEHLNAFSGLLHHPLETLASALFTILFAALLGLPVLIIILYGFALAFHAALSHANVRIPEKLDSIFRLIFVTPDMHRTHHSIDMREGNSNYGGIFSFWDRLFRTYTAHPASGESKLKMGLPKSEKPKSFSGIDLLIHPFKRRN